MNRGRIKQRIRLSRLFGHFYKWRMGDGSNCMWCGLCRRIPLLRHIIPYSEYGRAWCVSCGNEYEATAEDDWHLNGMPPCSQCRETMT